ncbi:histidine kinase N-terminal 7TM domain-containing protein [Niallia sp. 01092]|uniref:histidine kinase N-terminal 7TM domain-containing protein n=1 Tax=unclassified Niallia TaxID=2837522 RepID=UPI003FD32DAD
MKNYFPCCPRQLYVWNLCDWGLLLIRHWIKTRTKQWKQILILLLGIILQVLASFSYLIGITPKGIDPVPFVMFFTSCMYLWAIISTHWLVINPIAKDYIFESMRDGVIVAASKCDF